LSISRHTDEGSSCFCSNFASVSEQLQSMLEMKWFKTDVEQQASTIGAAVSPVTHKSASGSVAVQCGEHHVHGTSKKAENICSFHLACTFFVMLAVGCCGFLIRGLFQLGCTGEVSDLNSVTAPLTYTGPRLSLVSSSLVDDGTTAPPNPSKEVMEDLELSFNSTVGETAGADSGRRLEAHGLKERAPYIIRSKHPGKWLDAELSWDHTYRHPRASLEFTDPVAWELRRSGSFYRIHSMHPGAWYEAELSWDGTNHHPMASVEFHDPVDWQFMPRGGAKYRIVSKYQHSWKNAELSWDSHSPHPLVSVEHHDPVDWEVIPAYTIKGYWMYDRSLTGAPGHTESVTLSWGTQRSHGWSHSEAFAHTVTQSATLGFEVGGDELGGSFGSSHTVDHSVTREVTRTFSNEFTFAHGQETTQSYEAGEHSTNLWKFVVSTTNNHHKFRGETVLTHTRAVEATASRGLPPKCVPGYCKFNTGCQLCTLDLGCIGPCQVLPSSCAKDRYTACPYWKLVGYCNRAYVVWMNQNCHHSCECS